MHNDNMRNLATIQRIIDIKPIPNADQIMCATVLGWHVVVKKDEFKVGDLCIYFEVDSLLPIRPEFDFLAPRGTKKMFVDGIEKQGYRLKTVRLRGQISQGLCIPLSMLDFLPNDVRLTTEGSDVSDILDVIKYEQPLPAQLSGKAKGVLPGYIPKTDETRIQSVPQLLERYQNEKFYVTEKVDGTSVSLFIKDGEFNVAGRNINWLEESNNTYWLIAKQMNIKEKLESLGSHIVLQGELIGENIQGNRLKQTGQTILFFNAYDMNTGKYLDCVEFMMLRNKIQIPIVPVLDASFQLPKTVDGMIALATRKSIINPNVWAEGIVIRSLFEKQDEDIGRLSFKAINPEYLLQYGE